MLLPFAQDFALILGSNSPRRKELLALLGFQFDVIVKETDEQYDALWEPEAIVSYIAQQKLKAFTAAERLGKMIITADTIVVDKGRILGKPRSLAEAKATIASFSGCKHQVLTAVSIAYQGQETTFVETTDVEFADLNAAEIAFYVEQFQPLDKAGSYGIQEWIGYAAIKRIEGSYENVVGLPTARLYQEIKKCLA